MNCVACDRANASDRNYCGACGTPLMRYCSLCGFRNQAVDRFCGGCGAALATGQVRSAAGDAEAAPRPQPAAPGAPAPAAPPDDALADLLEAAREANEAPAADADVRVNQDDIDSLFGD